MNGPRRSLAFRVGRALFIGLAICYCLVSAAIWYGQGQLLYHPSSDVGVTPGDRGAAFENVTLPLGKDRLNGWWVPWRAPGVPTLLFFHGNAGNIAANLDPVLRLRDAGLNVFIIDYRGYGRSTGGPPREKLLDEDAERAWRYLVEERKIPAARIVIYGHSLGASVGVQLASHHPDAGALITEGGFTSIIDMATGTPAAYLPLRLIVTEKRDSLSRIGSVRMPKLFLHGAEDRMVPPAMAHRLYNAAPEPKQIAIIAGGGHENSAEANPAAYFGALDSFLARCGLKPGK